jgi:hypothetical protein
MFPFCTTFCTSFDSSHSLFRPSPNGILHRGGLETGRVGLVRYGILHRGGLETGRLGLVRYGNR